MGGNSGGGGRSGRGGGGGAADVQQPLGGETKKLPHMIGADKLHEAILRRLKLENMRVESTANKSGPNADKSKVLSSEKYASVRAKEEKLDAVISRSMKRLTPEARYEVMSNVEYSKGRAGTITNRRADLSEIKRLIKKGEAYM